MKKLELNWIYQTEEGLIGLFDIMLITVQPQFVGDYISEHLINYNQGLVKGQTHFCRLTGLLDDTIIDAIEEIIDGWFDHAREEANRQAVERSLHYRKLAEGENS